MDEIDPAARPRRRTFTAVEKNAYLDAYDALLFVAFSECEEVVDVSRADDGGSASRTKSVLI